MGKPAQTLHLRMSDPMAAAFGRLSARVPGLSQTQLARHLLMDQLSKPIDEQMEIISRQIFSTEGAEPKERIPRNSAKRMGRTF